MEISFQWFPGMIFEKNLLRYQFHPFKALTILLSVIFLIVSVSSFWLFWFLWNHDVRIVLVEHEDFLGELIQDCHQRDLN